MYGYNIISARYPIVDILATSGARSRSFNKEVSLYLLVIETTTARFSIISGMVKLLAAQRMVATLTAMISLLLLIRRVVHT